MPIHQPTHPPFSIIPQTPQLQPPATLYFSKSLAIIALAAIGAKACNPGEFKCGNTGGAPGPDASIWSCDAGGNWQFVDQCGGGNSCCQERPSGVFCNC